MTGSPDKICFNLSLTMNIKSQLENPFRSILAHVYQLLTVDSLRKSELSELMHV